MLISPKAIVYCFLEFKLRYLINLKLVSIRVKELRLRVLTLSINTFLRSRSLWVTLDVKEKKGTSIVHQNIKNIEQYTKQSTKLTLMWKWRKKHPPYTRTYEQYTNNPLSQESLCGKTVEKSLAKWGLEPRTSRIRGECSTNWATFIMSKPC